ncbi:CoA-binding protein [Uliginosibacterium sediminicola]|uniref:CoA-binding protein n=1 Tax=Uliginosibacterium sediminicola TaxID=2024550 RepID=A0ABU9YXH6_9RHOO
MSRFRNPDEARIAELLRTVKTVAVVGLSPNPARPSYGVAASMQRHFGWQIVPVRPLLSEVLGEKAYASLREIPFAIDLVDVFRNPDTLAPIVDDAIAIGAPRLWLQDGVINEAEALRAQAAGIEVIMNRCVWRDALRFLR